MHERYYWSYFCLVWRGAKERVCGVVRMSPDDYWWAVKFLILVLYRSYTSASFQDFYGLCKWTDDPYIIFNPHILLYLCMATYELSMNKYKNISIILRSCNIYIYSRYWNTIISPVIQGECSDLCSKTNLRKVRYIT